MIEPGKPPNSVHIEMIIMIMRDQDEVDRRQLFNGTPGGISRLGPAKLTGLARSDH